MIKQIIFDLDGTLCDCRDMHFRALNLALVCQGFPPISEEDHLGKLDGLNTRAKLIKLGVHPAHHAFIYEKKQQETFNRIDSIKIDPMMWATLSRLNVDGFCLCVASNSIKETVRRILQHLKIVEWFDFYLSNEDVLNPKPAPDIYHMARIKAGFNIDQVLIIEDSEIGIKGAELSGAKVMRVKDSSEVTYENIIAHCNID